MLTRTEAVLNPVGWSCRIHRQHLCRGEAPSPTNECPEWDIKPSDVEAPEILEFWGRRSTPPLPSLPSRL